MSQAASQVVPHSEGAECHGQQMEAIRATERAAERQLELDKHQVSKKIAEHSEKQARHAAVQELASKGFSFDQIKGLFP